MHFLRFSLFLSLLAATSCRIVSTYQASSPILATPSADSKGDIALTSNVVNFAQAPLFGLTTVGLQAWYTPIDRLLLGGEAFYWHDQSKIDISGKRLSADLGELHYSGAGNGVSGGLSVGTYWSKPKITWVLMGGYSQDYSYTSHNANYYNPSDTLAYNTERRALWAKPWIQGHFAVNLGGKEQENGNHLYFMAGYRLSTPLNLYSRNEKDWGVAADIKTLQDEYFLRYVFSGPKKLSFMHQPFIAFKAEGRRMSGGFRFGLNLGSNRLFWHNATYSFEPMLAIRF